MGGADGVGALRPGRPDDARAVGELHARLITEGFLSSLGPRFLRRLYGRIARSPDSFVLVVDDAGKPVGFVAGTLSLGRLYRRFLALDGLAAGLAAPLRLAGALPTVLETLRHGRADHDGADAELLAVAVDPAWRGRQLGVALVEGFLAEVARRGARSAQVVVGAGNERAIAVYRRCGFAPARTFEMHRGTTSLLLQRPLGAGAEP